mgnify:CR=1 FL=1
MNACGKSAACRNNEEENGNEQEEVPSIRKSGDSETACSNSERSNDNPSEPKLSVQAGVVRFVPSD